MKGSGKPDDRNGPVRFEAAGAGNGFTVRLVRHRQTKGTETDRLYLRDTASVLDPTLIHLVRLDGRRLQDDVKIGSFTIGLFFLDDPGRGTPSASWWAMSSYVTHGLELAVFAQLRKYATIAGG